MLESIARVNKKDFMSFGRIFVYLSAVKLNVTETAGMHNQVANIYALQMIMGQY